jgi:pimeloyl-ACP methyl ester carboxylesterase
VKKDKTPTPLKLMRWGFPKLEFLAPSLARRLFIKLFFTPFRYPVPEKEKKAETFSEKWRIGLPGKEVQVFSWGKSDRYVLFVHGWAGRTTQFRRFVKPLIKAGFAAVGFDGPAHGQSQGKHATFLEFETTIRNIYGRFGEPAAIIAHSYGGNAVLYAAVNGLPVRKLVNIASPTIAEDIVDTYLKALGASPGIKDAFYDFILKKYGQPFDHFTALHFVKHLPAPVDLLLVHDDDDKEVGPQHPEALLKVYPGANLIKTSGLGHTRILRDDSVIREVVTFISK